MFGATFAGLDPALAETLLRQMFAGQEASHRSRFPDARHEIAAWDGAQAARIVTDHGGDAITLVDLAVMPAFQRQGIGSALLRDALGEAAARRLPLRLTVRRDNAAARRLYDRFGFTVRETGVMDLVMEWRPPG